MKKFVVCYPNNPIIDLTLSCLTDAGDRKEMDFRHSFNQLFDTIHIDNMKILKTLISPRDDILPLYDGNTKQRVRLSNNSHSMYICRNKAASYLSIIKFHVELTSIGQLRSSEEKECIVADIRARHVPRRAFNP